MALQVIKINQMSSRAQKTIRYSKEIKDKVQSIWNKNKSVDKDVLSGILIGDRKSNKATSDRLSSIISQMNNGTFNPNRRFAKNPQWQEFKDNYISSFFENNSLMKKSKLRELMKSSEFKQEMFDRFIKHVEKLENYKDLDTVEDVDTVKAISLAIGKKANPDAVKYLQKSLINKGYSNIEIKAKVQRDIEHINSGGVLGGKTKAETNEILSALVRYAAVIE